jgi:hypothetical protein
VRALQRARARRARLRWAASTAPADRPASLLSAKRRPAPAGELRWDEVRAGRDLHVIDGLTVTKMSNEGGDYATVLGTLCVASGQHSWNVYINHVEDSNLFIGVTMGGHDLNADPQEMKSRTYYLSNGTIRVAGGCSWRHAAHQRARRRRCRAGVWGPRPPAIPLAQSRAWQQARAARARELTAGLAPAPFPAPPAPREGKLVTRCAEPYAEGDLVTVQLDMDAASRHIAFYKNGVLQGAGDGLPGEGGGHAGPWGDSQQPPRRAQASQPPSWLLNTLPRAPPRPAPPRRA